MSKKSFKKLAKQVKRMRSFVTQVYRDNPKSILNHKQIAARLALTDAVEKQVLISVLESMVNDGLLKETSRGKFCWVGPTHETEGIILFNRAGMAFVEIEGHSQDILIPKHATGKAFHEDRVIVRLMASKKGDRPKGKVVEVVERARESFPATIIQHEHNYFAVPDNKRLGTDFYVPNKLLNGAKNGDKVVVHFEDWDNPNLNPVASIEHVLGRPGDMRVEGDAILAEFGLPLQFPKLVEEECENINRTISEAEIAKRKDFRKTLTFTIDPHDAKDFDDALSIEQLENGHWEVGVHIADVSHYLKEGSELDKEAVNRATSVYLVDRTVPMLPEVLSNQLCSLRPKEDKLCFSAVFELTEKGELKKEWFGRTVIHSDHRFTYEEAQEIIEGGDGPFKAEILMMDKMAKSMRAVRSKKGAFDFSTEEVKFELDDDGRPIGVYLKVMKDSNKLIEDFMLLANTRVAEFIGNPKTEKPKTFVYRIHDEPDPEKIFQLHEFALRFGHKLPKPSGDNTDKIIRQLLKDSEGKQEEDLIKVMAIRSMAKAEYSTHNIGHYGLGFPFYSHFTSPIRRYPDVIAHRLLQFYLDKGSSVNPGPIEKLCKHSSIQEKKASEAERASIKYKQVEFLLAKVGEHFSGIISGMNARGLYVELDGNKCEGRVAIESMRDDHYTFDEKRFELVGRKTGQTYQLGDQVNVKVIGADLIKRHLDFEIVEMMTF